MLSAAILAEIALGVASEFAADLLRATGEEVRSRFAPPAVRKAFDKSVAEALSVALSRYSLDDLHRQHYASLFHGFLTQKAVLERLVPLLDPRPGTALDTSGLEGEFEAAGYDPDLLPDFRLDDFLRSFLGAFYLAATEKPELRGKIEIHLLGKILVTLGSLSAGPRTHQLPPMELRGTREIR